MKKCQIYKLADTVVLVNYATEHMLTDLDFCSKNRAGALPTKPDAEKSQDFATLLKNLESRISRTTGISKEKEEILIQKLKMLKEQQKVFLKNQFVYDTVKVACSGDNSGKPFLEKAAAIIAAEELPSHIPIERPQLSPKEMQDLRRMVNERIVGRCARRKKLMYESRVPDTLGLPLSEGENLAIQAQKILSEDTKKYNAVAQSYMDKISTVQQTRSKIIEVCVTNLDWLEKKCSLLDYKLRILESKVVLAFHSADPHQMEALELIENILKEKLNELQKELECLLSLVSQYNKLRGTEYDEILQQYIGVLRNIKEKEWTLNQL